MAAEPMHAADALELVLMRLERMSGREDRARREEQRLERQHDDLMRQLQTAQEGNRRRDRDIVEAEAKIAEWAEYASQLRAAINAIDSNALRRKRIVLPDLPKPFSLEIPF